MVRVGNDSVAVGFESVSVAGGELDTEVISPGKTALDHSGLQPFAESFLDGNPR